jgi:hypothetical protein
LRAAGIARVHSIDSITMQRTAGFWLAALCGSAVALVAGLSAWQLAPALERPAVATAVFATASCVYCLLRALAAPGRPPERRPPTQF